MRTVSVFAALLCICVVAFGGKGPDPSPARYTVKIIDETGKPLEGMAITGGFLTETRKHISGMSDTNGLFVFECEKAMSGDCGFTVNHDRPGYYETHSGYRFTKIMDGRWIPWDPVVTTVVRRVINPIPMYAKIVETKVPETNTPCGYDLMAGDWTQPWGKGVFPDFVFDIDGFDHGLRDYRSRLTLAVKECVNGIQRLPLDQSGSSFSLCRNAPESGYEPLWTNEVGSLPNSGYFETQGELYNDQRDTQWGYVFRIRSVTNEQGRIVEAFYGKVRGSIRFFNCTERTLRFTYYLNPTSNDRNLEYDPKRNLFTDIKPGDRITAP